MSTIRNELSAPLNRCLNGFLRAKQLLPVLIANGLLLAVPAFAQRSEPAVPTSADIRGTVADSNSDPIPNATVVLQGAAGNRIAATTSETGSFALHDVAPGIPYQISVSADGFADWTSSVLVDPGQNKRKEHLNVKFISMPNGLQTELGATAGSIDFGFSSGTDSIEAAAQHAPIHAIWSYGTKLGTQCIGAPGISTAKGLIGKPVGSTGTDGFSITLLQACLEPAGVSLSQVKPINMVRSEFVPAMVAKKIDAAVFHADDAYVITHQLKGAKVLSSEYKVFPNWWYGGVSMLD